MVYRLDGVDPLGPTARSVCPRFAWRELPTAEALFRQTDGPRWDSPPKIRFAADSALERDGFEPLVPLRKGTASSETTLIDLRLLLLPEDQATRSRE